MEAPQNAQNEQNVIEPPNLKRSSSTEIEEGYSGEKFPTNVTGSQSGELVPASTTEVLPSSQQALSEVRDLDASVSQLVDDGSDDDDLKLDLPVNLDSEDFSKLLGFDPKHDDELFSTHDILGKPAQETESHQDEVRGSEKPEANVDCEMNINNSSDKDEKNPLENTDNRVNPNNNGNLTSVSNIMLNDRYSIKEETLSPRRTFSDLDNTALTPHQENGNALQEFNQADEHSSAGSEISSSDNTKNDKHTLATFPQEKVRLMASNSRDSLTPMVFQQHELKAINNADDSPTRGKNGLSQESLGVPEEQPTISAYARLDFHSFTFYVQTLHVIIGRRSENDFSHKVDVNLGPSKSISRRHAQIFYNFGTGRFELSIIGKNGAFVDDIFVERGNTVPLKNRTKIQVGQIPFQFALPEHEKPDSMQKSADAQRSVEPRALQSDLVEVKNEEEKIKSSIFSPKKPPPKKQPIKKEKKPAKVPKKVYTLEEIPVEYRTKPTYSYSALLTTCIRKYSSAKGMSLSEIYAGIRELFPYYKYCPDGWQSSVRHNLSLNKSFRKVSKEGKGWLWGLDEEYIAERELLKKKQAEAAAAKAEAAQQRLEQQQQQQRAKKALAPNNPGSLHRDKSLSRTSNGKQQNISQTLAANRSADKKSNMNDHQRTMKYLQEQLMILTRDRKGLSKQVIASILTQALAMTINQVTQAARNKGITGNPLTALMDKNPQHLNLILAAAVNAATSKVTNGEVKQLVNLPQSSDIAKQVKRPAVAAADKSPSSTNNTTMATKVSASTDKSTSFDPKSLSRFFQPRQPARLPAASVAKPTIPQKRSHDGDEEETSSSEESSESGGDNDDDDDDDDDDDGSDDDSEDSSTSSEDDNEGEREKESSDESSGESESASEMAKNLGEENSG